MPLRPVDTDRYIRDLDFLSDVTRETLSSLQLGPLLRRVVILMRDRFGYDYAAVALVERDAVVFRAGSGGPLEQLEEDKRSDPGWQVPVGKGIVGTCVEAARPRLCNDVSQEPEYVKLDIFAGTRAELAVPLIHQDDVLGVLDVQSNETDAFDETDVRLLEIVGALVAPAVHSAALHERWRRRMRYLHLLGEISRLVMSSLTQENVIEVACQAILEALDVSFAGIALLEGGGRVTHAGHATHLQFIPERRFSSEIGIGVVGKVVATGEAICIDDVSEVPEFIHVVPGMRSALCVPLRIRDRVIGALDVEHTRASHFSDEDLRHLENLSAYLAQALENARLFDGQRRRWQQLLVINEVARIATESLELDEILEQVVKEVHDRFGYFAVVVFLVEGGSVVIKALNCDEALELEVGYALKLGEGVAGKVAQSGQVLQYDRADQIEQGCALRGDIESILSVPLRAQAGVIGVIEVQAPERAAFDGDDRLVMETLAKSVAGAIANARSIQRAEQIREDLNRMIVHDLRNPVQAVLFTLQEIQRGADQQLPERMLDSVAEGITCTEDILDMVNSLLDVSRFEAGKAQLRLVPAVLNDHVRGAVRRLAPIARSKGIQVTTVLSQEVPVIRMDHELVDRTLSNLISNALKFTPEGARVTISTAVVEAGVAGCDGAPQCVLVVVKDTGEGIPPEYRDKIFEKFGQVESRKAGLKMSTGLGLTLCRYVVRAHGGAIWVESEPGKGSRFKFTLPCRR